MNKEKTYIGFEKPNTFSSWFKKNLIGILGTIIFHLFILILFLLIKIQSLREIKEMGVTLDFTENVQVEELIPVKTEKFTPDEIEYLERILAQQSNLSNRASNVAENLEKELSTRNYIDEVEQELDQSRSEEWKKLQEELEKNRSKEDFVPEQKTPSKEKPVDNFKGLTNITYEFLEEPFKRFKSYLPVPVYKCKGEGTVLVDITVDLTGRVLTSKASVNQNFPDMDCMMEVAEKYALLTQFEGNLSAPRSHKARIVYKFIAQ